MNYTKSYKRSHMQPAQFRAWSKVDPNICSFLASVPYIPVESTNQEVHSLLHYDLPQVLPYRIRTCCCCECELLGENHTGDRYLIEGSILCQVLGRRKEA